MNQIVEQLANSQHIVEVFIARATSHSDMELWRQAQPGAVPRSWLPTTYGEALEQVTALHHFLNSLVSAETCCAICSNTRPEWLLADLAILSNNCATVSIYTSLPVHDVSYVLRDSGARVVFAENQSQVDKMISIHEGFTKADGSKVEPFPLQKIISFDDCEPHPLVVQFRDVLSQNSKSSQLNLDLSKGRGLLASLVYTSGSTGDPKGVMQTHGNHLANLEQVLSADLFQQGAIFLYLPLAHSFARLAAYIGLLSDTSLRFPAITDTQKSILDLQSISLDLRHSNAQYIPSIPRLFEKAKLAMEKRCLERSLGGWLLRKTLNSAKGYKAALRKDIKPSTLDWFWYHATGSIRERLRDTVFGTGFVYAVSGGAKLSPAVAEFFDDIGISILQGYGLTETCVATNVNRPGANKIGSVGPVFEGIDIRICEDGEIAFRGPNVTSGYWNKPEETAASWDQDGWFHTGDIGHIDDDGFLFIRGRKKEIIVSAGGKKIAPTKVEKLLEAIPGVSQAILFGSDRPYCVALIVPSFPLPDPEDLDVEHHTETWSQIEKLNEDLANFEKVRKARFVVEEFTPDNGLLTPTMKLRRHEIRKRYRDLIWSMYDHVPHPAKVELRD